MDPLGDPLTTRPIQTGWEFTMEPYPSGQFGFIDDPDRQFGNGSVWTRTRTRSDRPEPWLTLGMWMRTIWRIRAAMRHRQSHLPECDEQTLCRSYYPPDRDSYLSYRGWSIESYLKFFKSQFLIMLSPISSDLSVSCAQPYHHLRT